MPVLFKISPLVLIQDDERFAVFGYGSSKSPPTKVEGEKYKMRNADKMEAPEIIQPDSIIFQLHTDTKMEGEGREDTEMNEVKTSQSIVTRSTKLECLSHRTPIQSSQPPFLTLPHHFKS